MVVAPFLKQKSVSHRCSNDAKRFRL